MPEKEKAEEDNRKIKFSGEIKCPECGTILEVEAGRLVIEEPIKGEYQEFVEVRKSPQSKLPMTMTSPRKETVMPASKDTATTITKTKTSDTKKVIKPKKKRG